VATEVKEHEERSHSARYLILIFLVGVATCGVFFSAGFLVGRNERSLHVAPSTEVVTSPGVIPPTVNPPPESPAATPQTSTASHVPPNPAPDTVVIPPGGGEANPGPPPAKPASNPPSPPTPRADVVSEGITLQVVALHNKVDAGAVVDILKSKGYPVFLVTPEYAHADDNLFRVQVGPFRTREDADKVRKNLEQEGFKPFIKH